jgi:predicted transcriptional regulator
MTIAGMHPASLQELADRTGRRTSNLSRTLKTMERYGFVRLHRGELGASGQKCRINRFRLSCRSAPDSAEFQFADSGLLPYSKSMEVHFSPEQEARLAQIAVRAGTDAERVVTNVVARYLDEEARFLAAVEKGIAAAKRDEFIEEEEMDARVEAMFKR